MEERSSSRWTRPAVIGSVVAAGFLGAMGLAHAQDGQDSGDNRPRDIASVWTRLIDEGRVDQSFSGPTRSDPAHAAALANMFDEAAETGLVPVAEPDGGFVAVESLSQDHVANARDDLFPVYNADGQTIAYWGLGLGAVDKELVESGDPLDFEQLRAENGVTVSEAPATG